MAKNLRWKLLVILGVVALSVYAFYPLDKKVRLGLDLKGGVHLVLRVQVEDAVRLETDTTADRLREQLKAANIPSATVTVVSPTEFRVDGVPAGSGSGVPRAADRCRAGVQPLLRRRHLYLYDAPESGGAVPRRSGDARPADHRAARQRAGRGRADRDAPQRRRSDPRAAARRHRRRACQGDHQVHGAARAQAGRAGARSPTKRRRVRPTATTCRRICRSCLARARCRLATVPRLSIT